jgi:hypothetical protein
MRNLGPQGRFREDAMVDYLNYREDIEAFMPDVLAFARAWDAPPPKPEPAPRLPAAPSPPEPKDDEEENARYFNPNPGPARVARSRARNSRTTFGELLGGFDPDDLGETVFSLDEEIQTPEDARRLIARMRRR